jgi:hypothetical protein
MAGLVMVVGAANGTTSHMHPRKSGPWKLVGLGTLAAVAALGQGCSSSGSDAVSSLSGVYVANAGTEGAYQELGFYDASHYFLWKANCTGDGDDCLQSGTYTLEEGTLALTDAVSGERTSLPFSVVQSESSASSQELRLLGGGSVGAGGLTSDGGVALTSDAGTSLTSRVLSFLLSGQTFLVWGPSGLTGNFASRQCESLPDGTYELRRYTFGAKAATASWDRFSDPSCSISSKLMSIVLSGTSKVNGLSGQVLGAANITVSIANKTVTPTAAGIAVLDKECSGGVTFQAGVAASINTGCGPLLQQTNDCPAEYDLMSLTTSGLVFGDRSHPLCSQATRPTALSQWAVVPGTGYVSPGGGADASTDGGE